jgi:hypothetical protein
MECGQGRVAYEFLLKGEETYKIAPFFLNGYAKELEIRYRANDLLWRASGLCIAQFFETVVHFKAHWNPT